METEALINIADFKKRLDAGNIEFIFDLRNSDEFASWRIAGTVPGYHKSQSRLARSRRGKMQGTGNRQEPLRHAGEELRRPNLPHYACSLSGKLR